MSIDLVRHVAGAAVRYVRHTLEDEEVAKHIKSGKAVARLAMTWNDKLR